MDPLTLRIVGRHLRTDRIGMDPLVPRIIGRFLQADVIGDPHELLKKFDAMVAVLAEMEPDIKKMREAEAIMKRIPDAEHKAFWSEQHGSYSDEITKEEAGLVRLYGKTILKIMARVSGSLELMKRTGAWELFLALLQQFALPPKTRKTIEMASKFFAKTRVQMPKKEAALDAYEKMLKTFREMSMAAHDAIAHGKPLAGGEGETPEKVKAGPFTLINTGGFSDKVIAECAKVVETAAHLLQSHGMGKVCYGDVLISNTISRQNVLAFYLIQKDELFVRANLKGKEGAAVATVLHELGHRLSFKFLKDKEREIAHIYQQIAHKESTAKKDALERIWTDPSLKPKVGDEVKDSKGHEYVVSGWDYSRGQIVVQLVAKDQPAPGVVQKARINLEGYAALKGILPKEEKPSGFVTAYAKTSDQENFAEMVAYYCLGKLHEDQVEMLKTLL